MPLAYTLKTIAKELYFQSKNKNKKTDAETDSKTIKQSTLDYKILQKLRTSNRVYLGKSLKSKPC